MDTRLAIVALPILTAASWALFNICLLYTSDAADE